MTVIIAAYNEERDLAEKLKNTLALDYPKSNWKFSSRLTAPPIVPTRSSEASPTVACVSTARQERHGKTCRPERRGGKSERRDLALLG